MISYNWYKFVSHYFTSCMSVNQGYVNYLNLGVAFVAFVYLICIIGPMLYSKSNGLKWILTKKKIKLI